MWYFPQRPLCVGDIVKLRCCLTEVASRQARKVGSSPTNITKSQSLSYTMISIRWIVTVTMKIRYFIPLIASLFLIGCPTGQMYATGTVDAGEDAAVDGSVSDTGPMCPPPTVCLPCETCPAPVVCETCPECQECPVCPLDRCECTLRWEEYDNLRETEDGDFVVDERSRERWVCVVRECVGDCEGDPRPQGRLDVCHCI